MAAALVELAVRFKGDVFLGVEHLNQHLPLSVLVDIPLNIDGIGGDPATALLVVLLAELPLCDGSLWLPCRFIRVVIASARAKRRRLVLLVSHI